MSSVASKLARLLGSLLSALFVLLSLVLPVFSQTTVGTGSIVGTVIDPSGAVISGILITITNTATGQTIRLFTNSAGEYNSGALLPGNYKIEVNAKGFISFEEAAAVQIGTTTAWNVSVRIGKENQVIEVRSSDIRVNTEQATVGGVLSARQIENLPVNGRNFLDLAQLEPGVQIQDGADFAKDGFSSVSFGGRFGRTARIEVDGVDVSDEIQGTTTMNIPASGILEFQLSQSSLDLSTELTSSGAVNVATRSGTNVPHGEAFGFFRDSSLAAALPAPPGFSESFQREQFGGLLGGPILKNRFFYFVDAEHTQQHSQAPVLVASPFAQYSGSFSAPFSETVLQIRADALVRQIFHAFYRFNYFKNDLVTDGQSGFSVYRGTNITRTNVAGADFYAGGFSHSFRFGYLNTELNRADTTRGSSLPFASFPVSLHLGNLYTGPNFGIPFDLFQDDLQFKYDGSKSRGVHLLRYGVDFSRIIVWGFAPFTSLAPTVVTNLGPSEQAFAAAGNFSCTAPGGVTSTGINCPLNYPIESVYVGNGLGYYSPVSCLNFRAGCFYLHQLGLYVGDTWKWKKNLALSLGLRYVRQTGRTNSDYPGIPELNALIPGLGDPVRQPNLNFAPQIGFAWNPRGTGKTAVRGGAGIFYEKRPQFHLCV